MALFVALRLAQQALEHLLAWMNRRYWRAPHRQREAASLLALSPDDLEKTLRYAEDRYLLARASGWAHVTAEVIFLSAGGLGWAEQAARALASRVGGGGIGVGLAFFGILGVAAALFEVPFDAYATFVVEERHGFNRQTLRGFLADRLKGLLVAVALGGTMLTALLLVMVEGGPLWWALAWAAVSAFQALMVWVYPTLLAPLFNRFTPLPEGELRERIGAVLRKSGFHASGLFVMDASRRTAHGNAYFTGLFRDRRIVLFDTLVEALTPREAVAVLAHELGHFKLSHVRWQLLRGSALTGATFFLLSRVQHLNAFYAAFRLEQPSAHGALAVFGLWFGLLEFLLQPLWNGLSRRQERAADAYVVRLGVPPEDLAHALLALRERSRALPITHPLYSRVYHSHPPLVERLRALGRP